MRLLATDSSFCGKRLREFAGGVRGSLPENAIKSRRLAKARNVGVRETGGKSRAWNDGDGLPHIAQPGGPLHLAQPLLYSHYVHIHERLYLAW